MSDEIDIDELDLSDAGLMEVLKNHGMNRRTLLKVAGVGAGVAGLSGSVAGKNGNNRKDRIDEVYGASYAADVDTVPSGIVDHAVDLHIHGGDATHEGFPAPDGDDDNDQDDAPETFFDPVGLHVKPGEVVSFTTHGVGLHTVTSFHPKFSEPPYIVLPNRVPTEHGFTSPLVAEGDSWLYRFTEKGVYDLLCLPHVSLGMVMRIVVFDPGEDNMEGETFDEWGKLYYSPDNVPGNWFAIPNMVLTDDPLDPSNIVTEDEIAWGDLSLR